MYEIKYPVPNQNLLNNVGCRTAGIGLGILKKV